MEFALFSSTHTRAVIELFTQVFADSAGESEGQSIGNLAITYGDPAFYSRTSFKQISESVVQAPYVLSQPQGWLAQSLDGSPIKAMWGSTECVEALRERKYW